MKLLTTLCILFFLTACTIEIDGPDSVPNEEYTPEIPVEPEIETEWICFIPFEKDREWQYEVSYHQPINAEKEHYIDYCGTEIWKCTKVNWQDSIFVLGCSFNGERKIVNNDEGKAENVSTQSGWVQVQILNKKICLLQEGGDTLYPFAGELFSTMQDIFTIVLDASIDSSYTCRVKVDGCRFEYDISKDQGLLSASWQCCSEQDSVRLNYELIE